MEVACQLLLRLTIRLAEFCADLPVSLKGNIALAHAFKAVLYLGPCGGEVHPEIAEAVGCIDNHSMKVVDAMAIVPGGAICADEGTDIWEPSSQADFVKVKGILDDLVKCHDDGRVWCKTVNYLKPVVSICVG